MEKKKHQKTKNSAQNSLTNKTDDNMNKKQSDMSAENKVDNNYSNCKHNKDAR